MRSPARKGYADGPFGQIHYQVLGEGPAVVLLHQANMCGFQFSEVYARFADRGRMAIGVDLPGYGQSDPTSGPATIENYAAAVSPVLDALGVETACILGHHTGALVATEVALRRPERVSSLVLNGPYPLTELERRELLDTVTAKEKAFGARPEGAHLAAMYRNRERLSAGSLPADRLTDYVVQTLMGAAPFWYGHHAAFIYRHEDTLPQLRCPALILTNTGDMIHEHALRARRMRPDFAYAELQGGGVDIVDQQPDAWVEAVMAFLKVADVGPSPAS